MALQHHFQPGDRGAAFWPPNLRVYRAKVVTVRPKDDAADQEYTDPTWGRWKPEHWWVPLELRWGTNGQPTALRLHVLLGQGADKSRARPEDQHCNPGDGVKLVQIGAGIVDKDAIWKEWFCGNVGQDAMLIQTLPDVESATITAYGPELLLSHRVITGMWCPKASYAEQAMKGILTVDNSVRMNTWEAMLPVILNPNGKGNASAENWKLTSHRADTGGYNASVDNNKCKVFAAPGATAKESVSTTWTAYTALRSVVEWLDDYTYISYDHTAWEAIEELLGSTPIGQINLTGKNLLEAMAAILIPVGFGFAFEPWRRDDNRHKLIVFRLRDPVSFAQVHMAPLQDTNVSITSKAGQKAQAQRVNFVRDYRGVKNHVIVMGDIKLTQQSLQFHSDANTRDLHPYWDTSTYDLDEYADASQLLGPHNWASEDKRLEWHQRYVIAQSSDYDSYRHVFRSFAWNEDGALSGVINNGGTPILPTLTSYSDEADSEYAMYRPRPAKPFRVDYVDGSSATSGAFKPALLEAGIVGDDSSWVVVPSNLYKLSPHRCMITFTHKNLAEWLPWKAKEDTAAGSNPIHQEYGHLTFANALWNTLRDAGDKLRIRLTAAFEMDGSVTYEQTRQLDSSWPFDARKLVYMPGRFHYRDIAGSQGSYEATIDDSAANGPMGLFGQRVRDTLEDATAHGSLVLRGLHRSYYPGQGLLELQGRRIDLSLPGRRQNQAARVAPVIVGIGWNFQEGANKTELLLENGETR